MGALDRLDRSPVFLDTALPRRRYYRRQPRRSLHREDLSCSDHEDLPGWRYRLPPIRRHPWRRERANRRLSPLQHSRASPTIRRSAVLPGSPHRSPAGRCGSRRRTRSDRLSLHPELSREYRSRSVPLGSSGRRHRGSASPLPYRQ